MPVWHCRAQSKAFCVHRYAIGNGAERESGDFQVRHAGAFMNNQPVSEPNEGR